MSEIRLVGLVIPDEAQRVFLLHRRDHNQWQLPGGRILVGEASGEAAKRHALEELNVDVLEQRYLGKIAFSQGGVEYSCEWRQAETLRNNPILGDMDAYDDAQYHQLFKYNIRTIGVSPNVDRLIHALHNSEIRLLPTSTVQ